MKSRTGLNWAAAVFSTLFAYCHAPAASAQQTRAADSAPLQPPAPKPAVRPRPAAPADTAAVHASRLSRINAVKTWGYQLASLTIAEAKVSPYDLLVVDATTGLESGKPFTKAEVEQLKRGPNGQRRLVISYLSIGESRGLPRRLFLTGIHGGRGPRLARWSGQGAD